MPEPITPPMTSITVVKRPREGRRPEVWEGRWLGEVIGGSPNSEIRDPKEVRRPKPEA